MSRQHAVGINLLGCYHDQAEHQVQKNLRAAANPDELSAVRLVQVAEHALDPRPDIIPPRHCVDGAHPPSADVVDIPLAASRISVDDWHVVERDGRLADLGGVIGRVREVVEVVEAFGDLLHRNTRFLLNVNESPSKPDVRDQIAKQTLSEHKQHRIFVGGIGDSGICLDYFGGSGTTAHAVIALNREDGGNRKYILVEMGDHFDTVLKPRIEKVVYSADWKDGKPTAAETGISHCFKYMTLESYEDALNNIELDDKGKGLMGAMKDEYLIGYMMDLESKGSLISTDDFRHPFDYKLKIAVDSSGASEARKIDLVETFNYLIGLKVAQYLREIDKEYVTVEGTSPKGEKTLVVWRDVEKVDNAALNKLLDKLGVNPSNTEFDVVYVNGDHAVANMTLDGNDDGKVLKVRQIENEFMDRMFEDA